MAVQIPSPGAGQPAGCALSVVVPVHDEVDSVESLVGEIVAACAGANDYEIVYVDDGSADGTLERLRAVQQRGDAPLRIIHHPRCLGQSSAIRSGVRAARGEWIATLDGDGQNDPGDIPRLLELTTLAPPAGDMIAGNRRLRRDSWLRRFSSRTANGVRRALLDDEVDDTGCGLKLFRRSMFLDLPYFDHMHRFLPALFRRHGGRVITCDVNHRPRQAGRSKYGVGNRLWVGIVDLFGVLWLMRRTRLGEAREIFPEQTS